MAPARSRGNGSGGGGSGGVRPVRGASGCVLWGPGLDPWECPAGLRGSRVCCAPQPRCRFPPHRPTPSPAVPHTGGGQLPPWGKPLWAPGADAPRHGAEVRWSCSVTLFTRGYPAAPTPPNAAGAGGDRAAGGWVLQGGPGPAGGSLAGVVDLDLLVDGGQHLPHSGLQPTQLGCFGIQHPLVPLVLLLQCCRDRGNMSQPGRSPLSPPPPRHPPSASPRSRCSLPWASCSSPAASSRNCCARLPACCTPCARCSTSSCAVRYRSRSCPSSICWAAGLVSGIVGGFLLPH